MTIGKYPQCVSVQDVWQATYDLSSAYTLNFCQSKNFLVESKENIFEYRYEIIKNNFIITHGYITNNPVDSNIIWCDLIQALKTQPFTEELAESLGFIKEKGKV